MHAIKSSSLACRLVLACLIGSATGAYAGAADSPSGLLLVANKGNQTLSIVDPVSGTTLAAVPENGITGHEVVASADGRRAFVPIYSNTGVGHAGTDGQLIRVINLAKHEVVGTVDLGHGLRPHCAVIGPRDGLLYVTTELDNCITVIDPDSLKILHTVPTGQPESHMLALSHDGRRGYTANVGPGTVSVLDIEAKKVVTIIPVSRQTQRISISADDRQVFTADQTQPRLAVIDTATNGISAWIDLPSTGYGTAPTPDGHWLLVALNKISQVGLIDLHTLKLVRTLPVPKSPQEVLVQPDGKLAYVSCDASRQVAVISLADWQVTELFNTGPGTDGLAWARQTR